MFFKKKVQKEATIPIHIKAKVNPKITIELLENGSIFPSIEWEPHSNFNSASLVKVIDLINNGKMYESFKKAILAFGEKSGDIELANMIASRLDDPSSLEEENPIIFANMVSKYHFSQNKLTLNQEG